MTRDETAVAIEPLFLSDSDIEFMTGYKQPAAQIRWLQKWRIRHAVAANGRPRVTREAVNGAERPKAAPNFAALRREG